MTVVIGMSKTEAALFALLEPEAAVVVLPVEILMAGYLAGLSCLADEEWMALPDDEAPGGSTTERVTTSVRVIGDHLESLGRKAEVDRAFAALGAHIRELAGRLGAASSN